MPRRWGCRLAALAGLGFMAAAPADAADLVLKRVVLSTGGVGYFEYEADVQGDATLSLDVALDQVDDVLKSLVVYDSGGTTGEITLPGREPQTKILSGTPFEGAANSLAGSRSAWGRESKYAVAATTFSAPSDRTAAASRNALSAPPLNATMSRRCDLSRASSFASRVSSR